MKRKAVYAASLDPITYGHINVIERTAPLYDQLVVMVAADTRKNYAFTPTERMEMAKASVSHLPNVVVDVCIGRYVIKKAEEIGAQVVIRGLRNSTDLEAEQVLAIGNRNIRKNIETLFIPCLPSLMHVSSSAVKNHVGADPEWEEQAIKLTTPAVVAKLKENFILGKARRHWASLIKQLENPKRNEKALDYLLAQYNGSYRKYHKLSHPVDMLDEFELIGEKDEAIILAIWIHDGIYNPQIKDSLNVAESAQMGFDLCTLELGLSGEMSSEVRNLVLTTDHSKCTKWPKAQLLVDLDLMILGKSEKEFDSYEKGIRHEYEWVPEEVFRKERAKILQYFLDRDSIYSTKYFQDKYESMARKNLKRSIRQLTS